jgi:hypothetical protein
MTRRPESMGDVAALARRRGDAAGSKANAPPELYQVVIECKDEAEQRELFERLRGEGWKVRLLVL